MSIDPIALARQLINCPSVTPARGEVFDALEAALRPLGFEVNRWVMGDPPDGPTENMVAIRDRGGPHFGFAGHLDVVPPGEGWSGDPFAADIEDGLLMGRGANDMKSAIAADYRLAERAAHPPRHDPDRRANLGRAPRRHGQDRPQRLGQYVDRGAGRPGPCRLPP